MRMEESFIFGFQISLCFIICLYRKYLLDASSSHCVLLFLWEPGTWGGIYLDYSQYPLSIIPLTM